jgi:hypothetical protein
VHDGLLSYDEAYQKEFYTLKNLRTMNIRSVSVRNEGLNSKVERLNGTVRDREVVMRGMDHKESTQTLMEALIIMKKASSINLIIFSISLLFP